MMMTFEQYGHSFKSARSMIITAFGDLIPSDEIVFNEIDGQLHVIIYCKGVDLDTHIIEDIIDLLQAPDCLGDSIQFEEIRVPYYIKLIVDQKLLEGIRREETDYVFDYDKHTNNDLMSLKLLNVNSSIRHKNGVPYTYFFAYSHDSVRGDNFLKDLKMLNMPKTQLDNLLNKSVLGLNNRHDLTTFDTVVYPHSSSNILKELSQKVAAKGGLHLYPDSFVKVSRTDLKFDDEAIDKLPERTKNKVLRVKEKIVKGEGSFKISEVFSQYRKFILDFIKFNSTQDRRVYNAITGKSVILIDDFKTTGKTITTMLDQLSVLCPKEILVFVLIKVT